jgi:hypothetical protein
VGEQVENACARISDKTKQSKRVSMLRRKYIPSHPKTGQRHGAHRDKSNECASPATLEKVA